MRLIPLVILALLAGCQPLPPGRLDEVRAHSGAAREGSVYLLRGWQDLYSGGIDELAAKLRRHGLHAEGYRANQWRELAATIARRYQAVASREPLVLIGFSYGADDSILTATYLQKAGLNVDLIVTIDPVTPPPVPANVQSCYNYFQTNGVWDVFPWLRGVPLRSGGGRLVNVDIRRQRRDLVDANLSHATIAANARLHDEIIRRVLAVCPRRGGK